MVLGQAATAMAGMIKNRGSDSKSFVAGNAAMQGVIAAELIAMGFTANDDIIEGDIGLASLVGYEGVDPQVVLAGLGQWDMVERSSTLRLHACCGASHFSQDALQKLLQRRPTAPGEIDSITVEISDFLMTMMPYHAPETGLQAKYSLEYDLAAIALDGKAGFHEYSDAMVRRPEAKAMMQKVTVAPKSGGLASARESRVVVKLKSGEVLEESASRSHGSPADPLTPAEITGKFNDCAGGLANEAERNRIIDLCLHLDGVANVRELTEAVSFAPRLTPA
jgi:2-methylcitrate dehydratase PrpD